MDSTILNVSRQSNYNRNLPDINAGINDHGVNNQPDPFHYTLLKKQSHQLANLNYISSTLLQNLHVNSSTIISHNQKDSPVYFNQINKVSTYNGNDISATTNNPNNNIYTNQGFDNGSVIASYSSSSIVMTVTFN